MELDPTPRPASVLDVLDVNGLMSEMLHIHDDRTVNRLIAAEGLPVHRGTRGRRLFIRGEVLDWLKSRCSSPVPEQSTDQAAAS